MPRLRSIPTDDSPCPDPTCRDGILGILSDVGRPIHCDTCASSVGILFTDAVDEAFDSFDCHIHYAPYPAHNLANA